MINLRSLKGFLFAFLLVLAGGLIFIGGAQSFDSPTTLGELALVGLVLIILGLFIGLIAAVS